MLGTLSYRGQHCFQTMPCSLVLCYNHLWHSHVTYFLVSLQLQISYIFASPHMSPSFQGTLRLQSADCLIAGYDALLHLGCVGVISTASWGLCGLLQLSCKLLVLWGPPPFLLRKLLVPWGPPPFLDHESLVLWGPPLLRKLPACCGPAVAS